MNRKVLTIQTPKKIPFLLKMIMFLFPKKSMARTVLQLKMNFHPKSQKSRGLPIIFHDDPISNSLNIDTGRTTFRLFGKKINDRIVFSLFLLNNMFIFRFPKSQ